MKHHNEEIIDGLSAGLMKKGDTVTWQATHLFKARKLKVIMRELKTPDFFADEMLEGDFKQMRHEHIFKASNGGTLMIDKFYFKTPFEILGKLAEVLFLETYMKSLLLERNKQIKHIAETNLWKQYL